jgi:NhaA family Na+:H+ antiporter
MLTFFKIERNAALLLLLAAAAGLVLANSAWAHEFNVLRETLLGPAEISLNLPLHEWLGEGLMTAFFLLIGLELKREVTAGALQKPISWLIPGLAALFGAIAPALIFVFMVCGSAASGWPIPMATDVTFALAVFAVFGRAMPPTSRVFLLSFAVIDDLIAILVIAIFLSRGVGLVELALSVLCLGLFAWMLRNSNPLTRAAATLPALLAWYFMLQSGVSPLIVGIAAGLLVPANAVERLEKTLHPWVSLAILPIFALFAAGVSLSGGGAAGAADALVLGSAVSVAILVRPLGKVVGITLGALLGRQLAARRNGNSFEGMLAGDYLRVSVLGGIGFTVALLIANSIYGVGTPLANEAIVATLVAMVVSMALGALALASRR